MHPPRLIRKTNRVCTGLKNTLNIQECLEKSLKIDLPGKVLGFYHLQEDSTLSLEI